MSNNIAEVLPPKPTFTIREFCETANISRSHCHALVRDGLLSTIRFGRSVRITRGEAIRFLAEGTG